MDRLSSCYFCGIALDEPLRDYPLAPGDDDPNAVVTLCPTCRRKLETVLSAVTSPSAEESDDPAIVAEAAAELEAPGVDPEALEANAPDVDEEPIVMETGETSESEETAETTADDDEADAIETAADVTAAAESTSADSEGTGADDEPALAGQPDDGEPDGSGEMGGDAVEEEIENMMEPDVPEDLQTGETGDADRNSTPEPQSDESECDSETGADSEGRADTAAGVERGDAAESGGEDKAVGGDSDKPDGQSSDGEPAEDDGVETTVSALEYNKVMRLLQNREFPVDRAEIVAVAANAYELTESECDEVIDLAVDRGLIGQADGQLIRTDD